MRQSCSFVGAGAIALTCISLAAAADWPMYGQNLRRTFANDGGSTPITVENAQLVTRRWTFPTGDAVTASPAVVGGAVYVGAWDGLFYALDQRTGLPVWGNDPAGAGIPVPAFAVDCDPAVNPGTLRCAIEGKSDPVNGWPLSVNRSTDDGGIITSSAAVVDVDVAGGGTEKRIFFGGGKTLYALDAATGTLRWKQVICGNPDGRGRPESYLCESDDADRTRIFSSPAVYDGKVFVGTSVDGAVGYRGRIVAFDADDGDVAWTFDVDGETIPDPEDPANSIYRGCGSVWSSFAVDEENGVAYVGVADCDFGSDPPYHNRVLGLRTDTGAVRHVLEPPGLASEGDCDFDIGATPNLFDLDGKPVLGVGRKDGKYYVWSRRSGKNVRVLDSGVPGGIAGGFIGSPAYDAASGMILGATAVGDLAGGCSAPALPGDPPVPVPQDPSVHGLSVDGSRPDWHGSFAHGVAAGAVSNGILYLGTFLANDFRMYDVANGALLNVFPMPAGVSSGAAIVDGMVIVGSGSSTNPIGSGVHAFGMPAAIP